MLDEIGRGTSTREGTALGVALLEWLHAKGTSSGGGVAGGAQAGDSRRGGGRVVRHEATRVGPRCW